ncbi:patatin-like phospholipase family protein [Acholeplasma hippikon]|uniref:Patatin n=1 Tax=Acholeplasma hippikon TaxID=264636 RepID=A0A449BJG1_9MOLU|nr:patatin-like phospholipase family protein [Acholeplasma hippikon]VEU82599.1 Patatin [Acholeplasma hippikon]
MKKAKIGLMLGGGGAKGSYQLGVVKALMEAGILKHVNSISGTSIGAINTLLLMSKLTYKEMADIWADIDNSKVFATKGSLFNKESNRLYSIEPLARTLLQRINMKNVQRSKYNGYATTALMYDKASMFHQISTDSMEKKVWKLNDMEEPYLGVMASASIPVVFGPTKINGLNYVDGGVLDNYPIQPLIDDGCNLIFAVPLDNKFKPELYDNKEVTIVNLTSKNVFENNIIKDLIDTIKFESTYKEKLEDIGYLVGSLMTKKVKEQKIQSKFLWFDRFLINEGFNLIDLNEDDEQAIKDYKLGLNPKLAAPEKNKEEIKQLENKEVLELPMREEE